MFRPLHLLVLAFTLFFVPRFCRQMEPQPRKTQAFLRFSAVLMLFFDPAYWLWEWQTTGRFHPATSLPLYLCSLFWMLLPIAVFSKQGLWKRIALANLCTFGLMGGVLGLVFNIYLNQYPFFSFVPLRSLLYHFMMILVSALLWKTELYRPRRGDAFLCWVPVGMLLIPCAIFSRLYGWDYCYLHGGQGTPLAHLSALLPPPFYFLVLYGGLALVVYGVFFRAADAEDRPRRAEEERMPYESL